MIKLIATDMDGTLLDNDSNLPNKIEEMLDFLETKEIPFVAASGRSLYSIEDKFGRLAERICIVSDNGALVKHKGDIVYSSVIPKEDWMEIAETSLALPETSVVLIATDGAYKINRHETHTQALNDYFGYAKDIQSLDEVESEIIKVTLLSLNTTAENFETVLYPKYDDKYSLVYGAAIWIDFMNKEVHKANGLSKLLELYNVSADEAMAFGDYHNDIQMLQLVKHSHAVANAHDDVKAVANEIVEANIDNAVINTIYKKIK